MFREDKATQVAAQFLRLRNGRIEYLHLLKLKYEADKRAALEYGVPITFDSWTAMRKGPLLSKTYDLLKEPGTVDGYWHTFIQKQGYDVVLTNDPGDDELSEAEEEIITGVFETYGKMDRSEVVDAMHGLPEWKPEWNSPDFTSSVQMSYEEVLTANGATEDDIETFRNYSKTQNVTANLKNQR